LGGVLLPKTLIFYPLRFRVKIFSKYIGNCLHGINTGCIFDLLNHTKRKKMANQIFSIAGQKVNYTNGGLSGAISNGMMDCVK
jgi:hypothetical protein